MKSLPGVVLAAVSLAACVALPPDPGQGREAPPLSETMARVLEAVEPVAPAEASEAQRQRSDGENLAQRVEMQLPVNLEVRAVPARLLFSALARLSGTDVVADQNLQGRVSLRLVGKPWIEALELAASSLGWKTHLDSRLSLVRVTAEACRDSSCTRHRTRRLDHRDAPGLLTALQRVLQGTDSLRIAADANSLILSGSEAALAEALALVDALDRRRPVVLVEAWVLEIGDDSQRLLGMDLGLSRRDLSGGLGGEDYANLLSSAPSDATAAVIARRDRDGLALRLAALSRQGYTRILSNPRIWVVEGEQAEIFQGDEVPYVVSTEQGGNHTQFRQAGLGLKVRPRVQRSGRIELDLQISKDTVDRSRENPPISRREMRTRLVIAPGEAALIGGISSAGEAGKHRGVPGLGAVGGLGERGEDSAQLLVVLSASVPVGDPS